MTNEQMEKWADKIAKLLRKAESTTPEEAEALIAKAQELMTQYAIEEYMIEAARGVERDQIVTEEFVLTGSFRVALADLTWSVLRHNGCRGVYMQNIPRKVGEKIVKQTYIIKGTGFAKDLARCRVLDSSLQIQALRAQNLWWMAHRSEYDWNPRAGFLARRQFLFSFALGVNQKLREGTARGRAEAEKAARAQATATSSSVEMVLADRKAMIDAEMAKLYGELRSVKRRQAGGDLAAHNAGMEAGRSADIGQPGLKQTGQISK